MFENNGNDEATWDEFDNNGSLSGAASYQSIAPLAQGNYYLSLEDSADYGAFAVAHHSELDFHDQNFAVSLWAYPIMTGSATPQFLLMKGDRSGNVKTNNYALRINNNSVEFIVHEESGANKVAKSSFNVVKNEWLFIAVFYDYSQSTLYMWNEPETVPIDTFDFSATLFPNENKLYIGTAGQNGFRRFWGRIDDVRISNKVEDIMENTSAIELINNITNPYNFILNQNYPNPFNPKTTIKFSLLEKGFTTLDVYNLAGQRVTNLINGEMAVGEHQVNFYGNNFSSGIYFYKLQQGSISEIKKMILVK
ncbi:MAG: LamG-like jellyroll fold domain-containing protein [Candidatus Kariarchaeaceae archaeon]